MKTHLIKNSFLLPTLIAGLGLMLAGQVRAQTFRTLYTFTTTPFVSPYTNSDGAVPYGPLTLLGNTLYGTTTFGGTLGKGTAFAINTDGTGFRRLHSFADQPNGVILSGKTLYGTTKGGTSGYGTVFKDNIDGTGFTTLYAFSNATDGAFPYGALILTNNILYGVTAGNLAIGSSQMGTIFALHTDGTGFHVLREFGVGPYVDGANPMAGLILSGSTLYGTTDRFGVPDPNGIAQAAGTVFAVNTDGTGFATLYTFYYSDPVINSDGIKPNESLILSGSTLYGVTTSGGSAGYGTVFAVNTDGTSFKTLYNFQDSNSFNSEGGLTLSGNTLYGTSLSHWHPIAMVKRA